MANALSVGGPNSKYQEPGADPAGFWAGLWHGMIMPITFFVGLFKPGVRFYETNNNGNWYNFGFFLGVASAFGSKAAQPPQDQQGAKPCCTEPEQPEIELPVTDE